MTVHDAKVCPVCKMTQRNQEAWDRGKHNALLAAGYAKDEKKAS